MRRVGLLFLLVGASACASRTPAPVATAPVQAAPLPVAAPTPTPVDPVVQAIATAEAAFDAGRAASQQGHLKDARLAFDLALDTLLVMPGGARSDPRLSAAVDALTDRISALELATLSSGDGFTETGTEPASIAYSLGAARENARRAREVVSTELWECLNTTRAMMPRAVPNAKVHEFFQWVRERSALAVGIIESATSRDDAWRFFTLGRSIERADMTARLLATRSLTDASGPSWTTILRSVGAYEAYLKTYRGMPSARNAAEFLLLDRLFPRSILFSILRAEACLRDLEPGPDGRVGFSDQAQRILGQMRSELEYRPISEAVSYTHLTLPTSDLV